MMTAVDADIGTRLDEICGPARVHRNHPLGPMTTYRVGGSADLFVDVVDIDELMRIASALRGEVPVVVIGRGSNLLVADEGFRGLALRLGDGFDTTVIGAVDPTAEQTPEHRPEHTAEHTSGHTVVAGAARSLPVVARETVRNGLTGFEWAVGVPGSIGGAVRMNAGGHGSSMAESVVDVTIVDLNDGQLSVLTNEQLAFGYRRSSIAPHQCVVKTTLRLAEGDPERGAAELSEIVRWRRANQPGGQNAGSVFTNPPADSAGRLIDAAGCKGLRVGTAEVSTKHANFFQADIGGSANDIRELMRVVRDRVLTAHAIELEAETRFVGFDDPITTDLIETDRITSDSIDADDVALGGTP